MNVAVACGGTGGHVFPGVATARALEQRGHKVTLWLAGRDAESGSVAGWNGTVISVRSAGFPSGVSIRTVLAAFRLLGAVVQCFRRMRKSPPDVLLAMGSYASVGPVLAARMLGAPVVLHEANAVPGRAISFLSRYASAVAVGFKEAAGYIRHARVVVTGFPSRTDLESRFEPGVLKEGLFTVLVMGGSQGAHSLNEIVPGAIIKVHSKKIPIQVIHLTGKKDADTVRRRYEEAGVPAFVRDFLREMGNAYSAASMAVARAGASTCTELSICGLPALLVPLPNVSNDHQTANATALKLSGGVDVISERELTVEWLADYIERVCRNPSGLAAMRARIKLAVLPGAAERLADLVESIAGHETPGRKEQ